jgi:hypothetical protein
MMKTWVTLQSTIAFIFVFSLPAWAVSLNHSFLIEKNRYDLGLPLNIEANEMKVELFTPADTNQPSTATVSGKNFYEIIFSDRTDLTENSMFELGIGNQNTGGATLRNRPLWCFWEADLLE